MEKVDAKVVPGGNAGGTTDSRSAGSSAEKVPASVVPGSTRKEETEIESEEIISEEDLEIAEFDIEEDVTALLSGEELSEEF